jgi:hypothetical protein
MHRPRRHRYDLRTQRQPLSQADDAPLHDESRSELDRSLHFRGVVEWRTQAPAGVSPRSQRGPHVNGARPSFTRQLPRDELSDSFPQ